jgi:hypothetical protein
MSDTYIEFTQKVLLREINESWFSSMTKRPSTKEQATDAAHFVLFTPIGE